MKVSPNDGLIVVDVQNDFCPGGALGVENGDEVVPAINALVDGFPVVVYTRDWHPEGHCSFSDQPEFVDKSWPPHCVQDTPGAAFHPELRIVDSAHVVSKGTDPDREAYSGFDGTGLTQWLRDRGIERVFIAGLATDYCVKATALDAHSAGFDTIVIEDACRAVNVPAGNGAAAISELRAVGAQIVAASEIET